jgi:hypothetical protein
MRNDERRPFEEDIRPHRMRGTGSAPNVFERLRGHGGVTDRVRDARVTQEVL